MNTTIQTIDSTTHRAEAGTRNRYARRILGAVAGVLLATGGLVIGSGAQPVEAFDIGGCGATCDMYNTPQWYTQPGSSVIAVDCTSGLLRINPHANVLAGYTGGQQITYRYHVSNNTGYAAYSAWGRSTWVPGVEGSSSYPLKPLPGISWRVGTGLSWTVQVQFAYYTSSGWTYSYFQRPTWGYSSGSTATWATCYT